MSVPNPIKYYVRFIILYINFYGVSTLRRLHSSFRGRVCFRRVYSSLAGLVSFVGRPIHHTGGRRSICQISRGGTNHLFVVGCIVGGLLTFSHPSHHFQAIVPAATATNLQPFASVIHRSFTVPPGLQNYL